MRFRTPTPSTLAAIVAAALASAPASAQAPPLRVGVRPEAGFAPVVEIGPVLGDDALERAARSGLPLRLRLEVELWRDRWIDDLEGSAESVAVLFFDPLDRRFLVRSLGDASPRAFPAYTLARAAAERLAAPPLQPREPGRYYYAASLRVETLSVSDLDELRRWLRGELDPDADPGGSLPEALEGGVKRAIVKLLGIPSRQYEARSGYFEVN